MIKNDSRLRLRDPIQASETAVIEAATCGLSKRMEEDNEVAPLGRILNIYQKDINAQTLRSRPQKIALAVLDLLD